MEPIEWAKIAEVALTYLKRFWYVVPIVALVIALHVTRGTLASRESTIKTQNQTIANLNSRNAVTQNSLNGALKAISDQNRDAELAAAHLQDAKRQAAADEARLNEQAKSTRALEATLQQSAKAGGNPCVVSNAAQKALEGL